MRTLGFRYKGTGNLGCSVKGTSGDEDASKLTRMRCPGAALSCVLTLAWLNPLSTSAYPCNKANKPLTPAPRKACLYTCCQGSSWPKRSVLQYTMMIESLRLRKCLLCTVWHEERGV